MMLHWSNSLCNYRCCTSQTQCCCTGQTHSATTVVARVKLNVVALVKLILQLPLLHESNSMLLHWSNSLCNYQTHTCLLRTHKSTNASHIHISHIRTHRCPHPGPEMGKWFDNHPILQQAAKNPRALLLFPALDKMHPLSYLEKEIGGIVDLEEGTYPPLWAPRCVDGEQETDHVNRARGLETEHVDCACDGDKETDAVRQKGEALAEGARGSDTFAAVGRTLVVIDGSWSQAKTMFKMIKSIHRIPRAQFRMGEYLPCVCIYVYMYIYIYIYIYIYMDTCDYVKRGYRVEYE
jgi:hypothetical protein